ncbi:hypothetical protein PhCBS80983_g01156 [Powellomyces hirtus]|uniref:Pseudouridine synthase RsuA/RluA-like domain-containing protein n=1 Tax=Powellomyces hirtus TaxID=109895 RepID=A0A507EB51_9FUNG|nr:hypothetical protein PhCBS80983_g01156 [Powellomyces hirtus]
MVTDELAYHSVNENGVTLKAEGPKGTKAVLEPASAEKRMEIQYDEDVTHDVVGVVATSSNDFASNDKATVLPPVDESGLSPSPVPSISVKGHDPRYNRDYHVDVLYYKPDTYLITNKPWDLRIDGDTTSCPTAESLLYSHFPQHEKLYLLHQLDYVTSGVHCWGLSKAAAGEAGKLFMSRDVKKTYSALVQGHVEQDNFVIDKPLVDDPSEDRKRVYVAEEEGKGKECQTHVEVVKRGYFHHVPVTHVKLSPVTGRRHQLRVHLQSVGHPIVGDYTYEQPLTEQAFRTMLHSWKLELPIPGQAPLRFEAPEPFAELIRDEPSDREDLPKRAALSAEFKFASEALAQPSVAPEEVTAAGPQRDVEHAEITPIIMSVQEIEQKHHAGSNGLHQHTMEDEVSAIQSDHVVNAEPVSEEVSQEIDAGGAALHVLPSAEEQAHQTVPNPVLPVLLDIDEAEVNQQSALLADVPQYTVEDEVSPVKSDFAVDRQPDSEDAARDLQAGGASLDVLPPIVEVAEGSARGPVAPILLDLKEAETSQESVMIANVPQYTIADVSAVKSDRASEAQRDADETASAVRCEIGDIEVPDQDLEASDESSSREIVPVVIDLQDAAQDEQSPSLGNLPQYTMADEVSAVASDREVRSERDASEAVPASAVFAEADAMPSVEDREESKANAATGAPADLHEADKTSQQSAHVSDSTVSQSVEAIKAAIPTSDEIKVAIPGIPSVDDVKAALPTVESIQTAVPSVDDIKAAVPGLTPGEPILPSVDAVKAAVGLTPNEPILPKGDPEVATEALHPIVDEIHAVVPEVKPVAEDKTVIESDEAIEVLHPVVEQIHAEVPDVKAVDDAIIEKLHPVVEQIRNKVPEVKAVDDPIVEKLHPVAEEIQAVVSEVKPEGTVAEEVNSALPDVDAVKAAVPGLTPGEPVLPSVDAFTSALPSVGDIKAAVPTVDSVRAAMPSVDAVKAAIPGLTPGEPILPSVEAIKLELASTDDEGESSVPTIETQAIDTATLDPIKAPVTPVLVDLQEAAKLESSSESRKLFATPGVPEYSLEDEVEAVESDHEDNEIDRAIVPTPNVDEASADANIQHHVRTSQEDVKPMLLNLEEAALFAPAQHTQDGDAAALPEYSLGEQVAAVDSDYASDEETAPRSLEVAGTSEAILCEHDGHDSETKDVENRADTESAEQSAVDRHVFTLSEVSNADSGAVKDVSNHILNDAPVYSLNDEVSAVASDLDPSDDDDTQQMQSTADEHLRLSYEYEAKWKEEREAADIKKEESRNLSVESEAADAAANPNEDNQNVTEVEAQNAVDDHLALSYSYQQEWEKSLHVADSVKEGKAESYLAAPFTGSVTPAKRSSEEVFKENVVVPAKRGVDELVSAASSLLPSKKANMSNPPVAAEDETATTHSAPVAEKDVIKTQERGSSPSSPSESNDSDLSRIAPIFTGDQQRDIPLQTAESSVAESKEEASATDATSTVDSDVAIDISVPKMLPIKKYDAIIPQIASVFSGDKQGEQATSAPSDTTESSEPVAKEDVTEPTAAVDSSVALEKAEDLNNVREVFPEPAVKEEIGEVASTLELAAAKDVEITNSHEVLPNAEIHDEINESDDVREAHLEPPVQHEHVLEPTVAQAEVATPTPELAAVEKPVEVAEPAVERELVAEAVDAPLSADLVETRVEDPSYVRGEKPDLIATEEIAESAPVRELVVEAVEEPQRSHIEEDGSNVPEEKLAEPAPTSDLAPEAIQTPERHFDVVEEVRNVPEVHSEPAAEQEILASVSEAVVEPVKVEEVSQSAEAQAHPERALEETAERAPVFEVEGDKAEVTDSTLVPELAVESTRVPEQAGKEEVVKSTPLSEAAATEEVAETTPTLAAEKSELADRLEESSNVRDEHPALAPKQPEVNPIDEIRVEAMPVSSAAPVLEQPAGEAIAKAEAAHAASGSPAEHQPIIATPINSQVESHQEPISSAAMQSSTATEPPSASEAKTPASAPEQKEHKARSYCAIM